MFNKTNLGQIRKDIDAALREVANKHGIDLSIGNIRFNESSFRTTLNAATRATGQVAAAPVELTELKNIAPVLLGAKFSVNKEYNSPSLGRVKFIGYHSRKPKYPFIVSTSAGKRFKITTETAKALVAAG